MRLPRVPRLHGAAACLLSLAMSGCIAPTAEAALLERVEKERACAADKLTVTSLGTSAVEGCGAPGTFICVSYEGWVCTKEGGGTTLAARALQDAPPPPAVPVQVSVPTLYIPPPPPPIPF